MNKLLDKNLVFIDADVDTSEDAIYLMASRLQEFGYVKEGYAQMVLDREKVFPTGLPGKSMSIAIPHTDPTLVIKPAIGVIIPRQPVEFSMMGEPDTKLQVSLIMPLVIKDRNKQIDLLRAMMHVIQDDELLRSVRTSRSPEEIVTLLHQLDEA